MKIGITTAAACLLLILRFSSPVNLSAEETSASEPWLLLERAQALIADREKQEMGEAVLLLRRAIEQAGTFPEAEIALGEIYFREGALSLAEIQLKKALEQKAALRVAEQKFAVLYRLAEIYELQGKYSDMEKSLQEVLADHANYSRPDLLRFRNALLTAFLSRGLDHTLRLYRLEGVSFALEAHAKLGWFYYRTGRFEPASLLNSLFALDIAITESVNEIRRTSPSFEYSTFKEFFQEASKSKNIKLFLEESSFFSVLYYLASACYAGGHTSRANELWNVLARDPLDPAVSGYFGELSRKQLRAPWVEPYINPSERQIEYPKE